MTIVLMTGCLIARVGITGVIETVITDAERRGHRFSILDYPS
jgi:hypothetical protein